MARLGHNDGIHTACDADVCFAAKMQYWREHGSPLQFTYGKDSFHGPTIRERQEKIIEGAAKNGYEVRQVNPRYDR